MRKIICFLLLSVFAFMLFACGNNSGSNNINDTDSLPSVGGAIMVTIRAEVTEIVSNRALAVEVIEPYRIYNNDANVLLPGASVTVIYGEDIDWISYVLNNKVSIGSIIEFSRGITLGVTDFLQEPFEVRGINIRIFDEDGNNIYERGF